MTFSTVGVSASRYLGWGGGIFSVLFSFLSAQPQGGSSRPVYFLHYVTAFCALSQKSSQVDEQSGSDVNNSFFLYNPRRVTTSCLDGNAQTSCQTGIIVGGCHRQGSADPFLSLSFCSIMALGKSASKPLFKYLWQQLTQQCQCSRWLMKGQDRASYTMEPQNVSWIWHCWAEGEVREKRYMGTQSSKAPSESQKPSLVGCHRQLKWWCEGE